MMFRNFLGALHRFLGKSPIFYPMILKLRNQVTAVVAHGLNDGIEMQRNGEAWLIAQIASDATFFIDIGANKGAWTSEFLNKAGASVRGIMYEPSTEAAQFIKVNFANQGRFAQVELVEAAVSDQIGTLTFYEEPGCGESSSLLINFSHKDAIGKLVKVTKLDTEIESRSIARIDMLKIDTEGFDLHVLRGAKKSLELGLIHVLQFEYNTPWALANSTLHEALEILQSSGYRVFLLRSSGLCTFEYDAYGEYYQYSNFVALSPRALVTFARIVPS